MNTTLNEIKKHYPCSDSWKKLLASLGKTKADNEPLPFKHILESNGIEDAIWALRVLTLKDKALFRADIAESVLHNFEAKYPSDTRPRQAVEMLRLFARGVTSKKYLRMASRDALAASDEAYIAYLNGGRDDADYAAYDAAWLAGFVSDTDTVDDDYMDYSGEIEKLFIKHFCRK